MNRKLLVGFSVLVVILIIGGGVILLNAKKTSEPQAASTKATDISDNKKSLRDLLASKNNQTCTFQDDRGNAGVVYLANNSLRGDFQTESDGKSTQGHTIIKDNQMYLWFDENTQGFKVSLSGQEAMTDEKISSVDIDQKVDYNCTDWTYDQSLFTLPSQVEFTDFSNEMESLRNAAASQSSNTGSSSQCAACNGLPDSAKAQCLQALSCN